MTIYLASKSLRRKELLQQMEVPFEILTIDTAEIVQPNETPEDYSKRVTREKLSTAWQKTIDASLPTRPILCADTEVVLNNHILGKPSSENDAFNMLKQYANHTHRVITSVGLIYHDHQEIRINTTYVTFSNITDEEIHHYLATDNYKDKSGSYGIQSYIGQFISHIDGCFYSVMGLPLNTVREMLHALKGL
jgi:septum formation protein